MDHPVIDGKYSDGVADYHCGDFTLMDSTNTYLSYSEADEGCLIFTVVDKPLHFTCGIARLLNPFSQLFLSKVFKIGFTAAKKNALRCAFFVLRCVKDKIYLANKTAVRII